MIVANYGLKNCMIVPKIGFGEAGNLLAAIEMDGLKCSQLGGAKCNKKAESHDFSQKSAEGDYEPSFNSLKERIEWMEFAVGDENWYQPHEEDYIDVVLDIEEWNENNANNSKLSNLVKQYKDRSFFRAESKNARISWKDSCKHGTINQMGGVNYCEKQFEGKCEPCGNRFCKTHLFTTQAGTFCFSCLPVELGAEN